MRLSLAVLALISNVSAVNLKNEVAAQKEFIPFASFINGESIKYSKPPISSGFSGSYSRSGAVQVSSNRMIDSEDYDQYEGQPKSFITNYAGKLSHAQIKREDDDSIAEAEAKQNELKATKAQIDANAQAAAVDAANKAAAQAQQAAAAKKAQEEAFKIAEWKRKFNPFDGQVHEDDGTSWNKGDGKPVAGVNKYLNVKNQRNKHHHRKQRQVD